MEPEATPAPLLEAVDVVKRYGAVRAVDCVSLAVPAGRVLAILGPSGSGKSTLLRCLNFLEVPDSGEIRMEGNAVGRTERELDTLRAQVGMVFQQFNLFPHMKVADNVALAPRVVKGASGEDALQRAMTLLDRVGLKAKAESYPSELSGGQQQRVAIARALAMEPRILLFDEPTSALDSELTAEVLDVMRSLAAEGRTMAIVTHEIGFAEAAAHEFVVMDQGKVVEQGVPSQVIHQPRSERAARFFARHRR